MSGEPEDNRPLVRLKPGSRQAEFIKLVSKLGEEADFDAIDPYGTIVFDGGDTLAGPDRRRGRRSTEPGNYVAREQRQRACAVHDQQVELKPASLPKPQATVTSIEFGFRGADTLHDGELVGSQRRLSDPMFQAAQVANAAESASKAEADLLAATTGPAAKKLAIARAGHARRPDLERRQQQESVITAAPGTYVMFCSMNTQDGREHFQLGMYRTITIAK